MTGRWISRLTLVVAVASLAACGPGPDRDEVEFFVPVTVAEIGRGTVEDRIVATGSLRAAETVTLTVETAGLLEVARRADGRRFAEGDGVRAGQEIARVTGEDARLAARTAATRQRFEAAARDLEATRQLFEQGLITETELERAETTFEEARLEYDRSRLTETRTRLVTPIDGVILRLARDAQGRPMPDGQLVSPGMVLAEIASIGRLIADVDVVGPDVARISVGQPTRVRHMAWRDRGFDGRVVRLAPSVDPITRALRAEVEVDNRDALLRPGMFVEVTVVVERREDVPVAPREAVTDRGGRRVVFVLTGQRVALREVVLGLGDDEVVEIRSGVEPGDRVVLRCHETLTDQTRVRVTGGV
jgi:RND family efflux transporter MFP subunit